MPDASAWFVGLRPQAALLRDVRLARRMFELEEADEAVVAESEHAVGEQGAMMEVQVEARAEALR
jgi:hypothetical protein